MNSSLENHWMQRARLLTQALILSGTLNIGFLGTSLYFVWKERAQRLGHEVASYKKAQFTNEQVLRAYSRASFQDLLVRLESKELVEEGYVKRDLALACLCAFHHLDIDKALGGGPLQKRVIAFRDEKGQEMIELVAFAGLQDEHFQALLDFVKRERWPLTTKGVFFEVVRQAEAFDSTLLEAFACTPEFLSLYTLFQKKIPQLSPAFLLNMLREGSWEQLERFSERLRKVQCYDEEMFREVLVSYSLESHSKQASQCLLQYESEYVTRRLDDSQLVVFLDLVPPREAKSLALQLLLGPRSDVVRQKAAFLLYASEDLPVPNVYNYEEALQHFSPSEVEAPPVTLPISEPIKVSKGVKLHKVQEGESLWKISRRYGVSIEAIMKANHLETDRLKPGRELTIPQKGS